MDHAQAPRPPTATASAQRDEARLVASLHQGDEAAFVRLVELHHSALLRAARAYVRTPAAAEEVVQETWAGALRNLPRFAGRSSLRTWLYRIMANQAIDHVRRERRSVPFSAFDDAAGTDHDRRADALVDVLAVRSAEPWSARDADAQPEARLLLAERRRGIEAAIAALPHRQRLVITLRDVEGWSADEAAQALGISSNNQRVLLHRARARVRNALLASGERDYPSRGDRSASTGEGASRIAEAAAVAS